MGSFLEQWNDPAIEVDLAWDADTYAEQQRERLVHAVAMAHYATTVPRRLGGDANPQELAADKKLSKKIAARSLTMLRLWGGAEADVGEHAVQNPELVAQDGAKVIWTDWWEDHKVYLNQNMRLVATTALRTGNFRIGNSYLNRLLNELNVLGQLFEPTT